MGLLPPALGYARGRPRRARPGSLSVGVPGPDGPLTPPRRGLLSRLPFADRALPGAAASRAQIAPWAEAWRVSNERDWGRDGPLWVVLGDSTAQGIGASAYDRGYAGQLRALLDAETGERWRLLNLSRSGDRAADVAHNQLPVLRKTGSEPRLVSVVVGANDLFRTPLEALTATLAEIIEALPEGGVVGTVPQGLRSRRAREVNEVIEAEARRRGARVADIWTASGPPWRGQVAADQFHPNDRGYARWANALAAAFALQSRVPVAGH